MVQGPGAGWGVRARRIYRQSERSLLIGVRQEGASFKARSPSTSHSVTSSTCCMTRRVVCVCLSIMSLATRLVEIVFQSRSMMNVNPLPIVNDDELLQTVTLAASQIPEQLKASTDRLKALLDTHAGTYNALHRIAADISQPLQVRQQSIIQFKNAALSHWRSRKSVLPYLSATHSLSSLFQAPERR